MLWTIALLFICAQVTAALGVPNYKEFARCAEWIGSDGTDESGIPEEKACVLECISFLKHQGVEQEAAIRFCLKAMAPIVLKLSEAAISEIIDEMEDPVPQVDPMVDNTDVELAIKKLEQMIQFDRDRLELEQMIRIDLDRKFRDRYFHQFSHRRVENL